jgi:PAS domain S-box-containing protein
VSSSLPDRKEAKPGGSPTRLTLDYRKDKFSGRGKFLGVDRILWGQTPRLINIAHIGIIFVRVEPFLEFIHPEDRPATIAEMERLAAGVDTIFFENRYRCKDGSYRWMQWNATPDFDQQLIHAAARDITERKHAEEALRESEERYRSVIAAMEDGIVLLDAGGEIRASNASAERILGLSAEQMIGRTSFDPRWQAIHEDSSVFPGEMFPAAVTLRTGEPCSNVVMGVRKPSGELTWISINSQPLFRPGEPRLAGVVASFTDITARKRTEEALAEARRQLQDLRPSSS